MPSTAATVAAPLPRRPLVGIAAAWVAGTLLGPAVPVPATAGLLVGAAAAGAALLWRRRTAGTACLLAACAAAAAVHAALVLQPVSPRDLRNLLGAPEEQVALSGVVIDDPVLRRWRAADPGAWRYRVRAERIHRLAGGWQRARGTVELSVRVADAPPPQYGDRLCWTGRLCREEDCTRGLACRMAVSTPPERVGAAGGPSPRRWCYRLRRAAQAVLARGIEDRPVEAAILRTLLLGYREDVPEDVNEAFLTTGTIHVFSISGLHFSMLVLILLTALQAAGVSRTRAALYLGPFLVLYATVTGLAASVVRSLLMALAYWSALFLGRKPDVYSAWALSAVAVLAVAPEQLRQPGFIYTFVIVAGLLVLGPPLRRALPFAFDRDPWQPSEDGARPRLGRVAARHLADMAVVGVAAWLASTPLTATFAHLVSPAALLGNLLVIPTGFAIVLSGTLSLALGAAVPWVAEIFNQAARVLIAALVEAIRALAGLPGAYVYVRSPPPALVVFWYAALAGLLLLRGRRRAAVAVASAAVAAAGLVAGLRDDAVRVETGGPLGRAVWVDVPGGGDVLVDPGSEYAAGRVRRALRARGADRLRAVAVTCADAEHAGAALDLLARMRVDEVWGPAWDGRSPVYRRVLREAADRGARVRRWSAGGGTPLAGGATWEVLHPPPGAAAPRTAVDGALAVAVRRGEGRVGFGEGAAAAAGRATAPAGGDSWLILDAAAHRPEGFGAWARFVLRDPDPRGPAVPPGPGREGVLLLGPADGMEARLGRDGRVSVSAGSNR